jgi:hypothetical protein
MPTRGGKLTILNCALWAIAMVGGRAVHPLFALPALIACWPMAFFWFVFLGLTGADHSPQVVVLTGFVIGINSLLWGYGLSWVISRVQSRRQQPRGFEVITPEAEQRVDEQPR